MANVLQTKDRVKSRIKSEFNIQFNLEKIIVKTKPFLTLSLDEWEKAGLRINISLEGFGHSYFNEKPYKNIPEAVDEFRDVLEKVEKGDYSLEIGGYNNLKLLID
ncbi:hypothetical protein JW949_01760 [Candidatus Woesearchaeota archaeon]|nr:hypothetical protein [Candidatus Woesearchaeota archaeon]